MSTPRPNLKLVSSNTPGPRDEDGAVAARDIIVAIPTFNEEDHIEACLESLWVGDDRLPHIRFVVADGGSTDRTREILDRLTQKHPNLDWIDNPGRLQSAGINAVAEQAGDATILVRCDAHSIYPPGYVTAVADRLRHLKVASLVVPMDAVGEGCFQRANAWVVDTPLGSGGSAHRGGSVSAYVDHGHHAAFDLAVFRSVGGYDPSFSHNEDAEYDTRIAADGNRIFLDANIRLAYKPRSTVRALARQYFNYGKGRARTIEKHRVRPRPRQLFPVLSLMALTGSFMIAPVFPLLGSLYPLVYFGALGLVSVWLAVRHRSACGLLAGLAALIMHASWALGFLTQLLRKK